MKTIKSSGGVFFILAISLLLVLIWFSKGKMLAGGEEGLWLLDPLRVFRLYSSSWVEIGLGMVMPFFLPRITIISLAILLSSFFPAWVYQALLYWFLLASGGVGVLLLTKEIMKTKEIMIPLFAALFYVFNLYTQSQVWMRFISTGMFAWAYLPVFLFLWVKWAREGHLKWLIVLLISSSLYSNAFGTAAFLFTLWIPLAIFFLYEILLSGEKDTFRKLILRGTVGFFSWFIFNFWWIFPYYKLSSLSITGFEGWKPNFDILQSVSQYFSTFQIILLRQSYLFGPGTSWYSFYVQPWTIGVSLGVFLISMVGLIAYRREDWWKFVASILFVGWFVSKGTNQPLGGAFFKLLFSTLPAVDALRNSYEKFGIVWLLPLSIFFALGLDWIFRKLRPSTGKITVSLLLILFCGILVWPMWTGDVFARSLYVNIPSYYQEANAYLDREIDDGRILQLPMIGGDSVGYDWGYRGVEPSEFLFDKPSVSKILRAKYFDDKYLDLYRRFVAGESYNESLDEMNIQYLVLHNDLLPEASGASTSAQTRLIINKNPDIHLLKTFGDLDIYEYKSMDNRSLFSADGSNPPVITYKKKSPTRYLVSIRGASSPFKLIFKGTYNDLWEAKLDGEKLRNHSLIYDYANGWDVNKEGDYNIEVVFKIWPWE